MPKKLVIIPSLPPIRSFLNRLSHASASTHDGIMYGTTTSAPNTPLKRMLVRTISHARPLPMPTPRTVTQTPTATLLNNGLRNRALESGPVKTRSRWNRVKVPTFASGL